MFKRAAIPDVLLISPPRFQDERGWFSESYSEKRYAEGGVTAAFVQDNRSRSVRRGVVRGLHFQIPPHAQGKLVSCPRGALFDVAVDLRQGSPTYGRHASAVLSEENGLQLWAPRGFAHGFCTLEDDTEAYYKVDGYYAPQAERGLAWDDPALEIEWPIDPGEALLSDKDRDLPALADLPPLFGPEGGAP